MTNKLIEVKPSKGDLAPAEPEDYLYGVWVGDWTCGTFYPEQIDAEQFMWFVDQIEQYTGFAFTKVIELFAREVNVAKKVVEAKKAMREGGLVEVFKNILKEK